MALRREDWVSRMEVEQGWRGRVERAGVSAESRPYGARRTSNELPGVQTGPWSWDNPKVARGTETRGQGPGRGGHYSRVKPDLVGQGSRPRTTTGVGREKGTASLLRVIIPTPTCPSSPSF